MTIGRPWVLIVRFALPLLLGNLLQQLYNIVDSIVVGQFVGTTALAAVGTAFPIIFLIISLFVGIATGATIIISQYYGAKDQRQVKKTIDTIYITMAIASVAIIAIGILLSRPLLLLINTPPEILPQAVTYMRIFFVGTIAVFGYNVNSGILQGLGDSRSPLFYLILSTIINIALDLLFVLGFGWGVAGVALATVLAQLFAFVFGIWHINKTQTFIKISLKNLQPDWTILKDSVRLGLPAGLQNIAFSIGTMALQRLINSYSPAFIAGFNVSNKIDAFAFLPMMTFSIAITTFMGQNIGAGKIERAKQGVKATLIIVIILCAIICPLIILFAKTLLATFTSDPAVITAGLAYLNRVMPFFVLLSILFIYSGALRGAGETMIPLLSAILSLWVGRVPIAYWLASFSRDDLYFSFPIGWLVGLLIVIPYYLSGRWKRKAVVSLDQSKKQIEADAVLRSDLQDLP